MNFFEKFMLFLDTPAEQQVAFGWFHLMWLGIMLAACVLVFIFRKKISRKGLNIALICGGGTLLVLELLKQLSYSFNFENGIVSWHYQTYAFPFQMCSTPMYLMLLAGILRKGRIYDSLLSYIGTFALFAGLIVMVMPGDVFNTNQIFIAIHTMIWHSSMVVFGFMILVSGVIKLNLKSFLKALIVFVILVLTALLMNIIAHHIDPSISFNMFYIGPYIPCHLFLLSDIYAAVPWFVFFMIYIIGFALIGLIIMLVAMGFKKLSTLKTKQSSKA